MTSSHSLPFLTIVSGNRFGKARGFEEFQTGHVTTGHTTVYLIQAQGFETIIQHELNRRAGIALFAVFHIVNHDSQAGPLVIRVEIVQVDQSDGLLGIDRVIISRNCLLV